MKQAFFLTIVLGCSLPISAMEMTQISNGKQIVEMKQPTIANIKKEEVVIDIKKEPSVTIFMSNVGLTDSRYFELVKQELDGLPAENYNNFVKKVHDVKPADPKSYVLGELLIGVRHAGHRLINYYRNLAYVGWGIAGVATTALAISALTIAANS